MVKCIFLLEINCIQRDQSTLLPGSALLLCGCLALYKVLAANKYPGLSLWITNIIFHLFALILSCHLWMNCEMKELWWSRDERWYKMHEFRLRQNWDQIKSLTVLAMWLWASYITLLTLSLLTYAKKKKVNRIYLIELCGDTVNTKCLCT